MKILGWHGRFPDKDKKAAKLNKIAKSCHEGFEWQFDGTLAEFASQWNDHFMALCTNNEYVVYVTHKTNFQSK